jgi:DNA-binding transcriptional MocR family regulator
MSIFISLSSPRQKHFGFRYNLALEFIMRFYANHLNHVETSTNRELLDLLSKPGIISFTCGLPDVALFVTASIRRLAQANLPVDRKGLR